MKTISYRSLCKRESWMTDHEWAHARAFLRAIGQTVSERRVPPTPFFAARLNDALIAVLLVRRAEACLNLAPGQEAAPACARPRGTCPPAPPIATAHLDAIFKARERLRKSLDELETCINALAPAREDPKDRITPAMKRMQQVEQEEPEAVRRIEAALERIRLAEESGQPDGHAGQHVPCDAPLPDTASQPMANPLDSGEASRIEEDDGTQAEPPLAASVAPEQPPAQTPDAPQPDGSPPQPSARYVIRGPVRR